MATTNEYAEYVCKQLENIGETRCRKMFGEFMVYVNNKPLVIICDNVPFVKKLDCIQALMKDAETGYPYHGAKEHYILDIDNDELRTAVVTELEKVTPVPRPKKRISKQ